MTTTRLFVSVFIVCAFISRPVFAAGIPCPENNVYVDAAVQSFPPGALKQSAGTLQLFTHGRPGALLINGEWKNAAATAVWLKENFPLVNYNHINIYGCEFAKGQKGIEAVNYLEQHLGVAIAASTNITGKGGDWNLEIGNATEVLAFPGYRGNLQDCLNSTDTLLSGRIIASQVAGNPKLTGTYLTGAGSAVTATFGSLNSGSNNQGIYVLDDHNMTEVSLSSVMISNGSQSSFAGGTIKFNQPVNSFIFHGETSYKGTTRVTFYNAGTPVAYTTRTYSAGTAGGSASGGYTFIDPETGGAATFSLTFDATKPVDSIKVEIASAISSGTKIDVPITITGGCFNTGTVAKFPAPGDPACTGAAGRILNEEVYQAIYGGTTTNLDDITVNTNASGLTATVRNSGSTTGTTGIYYGSSPRLTHSRSSISTVDSLVFNTSIQGVTIIFGGISGLETARVTAYNSAGVAVAGTPIAVKMGSSTASGTNNATYTFVDGSDPLAYCGVYYASPIIKFALSSVGSSNSFVEFYVAGGCDVIVPPAPVLTKSVSPASIVDGGTATYTFTIANTVSGNANQSGIGFTDSLPYYIKVAANPNVQTSNIGGATVTAVAGTKTVTLSNLSLVSGATATVSVDVTNMPGYTNADCTQTGFNNYTSNITTQGSLNPSFSPVCFLVTPASNPCTLNAGSGGTPTASDTDGDGINDVCDWDDDNDGILDADESPACFYTATEANTISKITSQFTSPDDDQSDGDIQLLHDASATLTFNFSAFAVGANPTGSNLFTIEYPTAIDLASITVSEDISSTAGANAIIRGSFDGTTWSDALTPQTLITATPTVFTITSPYKFKYYRIETGSVPGALATGNTIGEITSVLDAGYNTNSYPKASCSTDTDGDGIVNHKDLDADGDGCADALEGGGGFTNGNLVTNNAMNGGNTGGSYNGTSTTPVKDNLGYTVDANGVPTISGAPQTIGNSQYKFLSKCADTDGDSIPDMTDIDDDNDGIPDAAEAPSCYYTSTEANVISTITSVYVSPDDDQSDGDIQRLHDASGANLTDFNFSGTPSSMTVGDIIFTITYPTTVNLTSLSVSDNISATSASRGRLWGSIDGSSYVELTNTDVNLSTTPIVFTPNANQGAYKYYQIRNTVTGALVTGNTIAEITSIVSASYIPSAHPKTTCTTDSDGDGITNDKDLDSDGDGCYDTYEAGVTGATKNSGAYTDSLAVNPATPTVGVGTNGLKDALETVADNGTINYTSTYNNYAINNFLNLCTDTDADGIADPIDIDDDNDGVPDETECSYFKSTFGLYRPTWQTVGAANAADLVAGDILKAPNGYTSTSGTVYDAYMQIISKNGNTAPAFTASLSGNTLLVTSAVPSNNDNVVFDFFLVKAGDPMSNVAKISDAQFFMDDFDNGLINSSEVGGFISPSSYVVTKQGNTLSTFNYGGNTAYALTPALQATVVNVTPSSYPSESGVSVRIGTMDKVRMVFGVTGSSSTPAGGRFLFLGFKSSEEVCDTDGDGIPNHLDLDSDNDGCYDTYESGVTGATKGSGAYTDTVAVNPATPTAGVGTNGFKDVLETSADNGIANYASYYATVALSTLLNACNDTDSDGIPDLSDIDDDNDGVLDAVEAPSCYYTAIEANTIRTITSPLSSPDDSQTDGDIQLLHDGALTTYTFNYDAGQTINGAALFIIRYPTPIALVSMTINNNTSFGASTTARLEGSNDSAAWVRVSASVALSTTADKVFTDTSATAFRYYRILGDGGAATTITGTTIGEITSIISSAYVPSANPKTTCTTDTDNDGILNQWDLDSDGDGCSDASETGITGTLLPATMMNNSGSVYSTTAIAAGGYSANGFADALETSTESGVYTGSYTNYTNATDNAIHTCVAMPALKPDVNATHVGTQVSGNLSTNDSLPSGSSYSSAATVAGYSNPDATMPTINSNGTYTFTSSTAGIYKFMVTVCPPSVSVGCPTALLVIEVIDASVQTNKPFTVPDFASVKMNNSVTLKTLANDEASNYSNSLVPGSVTIPTSPRYGTAVVNTATGNITYTPGTGFTGTDSLVYSVCDDATPTANCNTAYQIITVLPASATNSVIASDDYSIGPNNHTMLGNLVTNDHDPDGNTMQAVEQQSVVVSGKGTFTLAANGDFTFIPNNTYTGPVNFAYRICDNASPTAACTNATAYFLISGPEIALPLRLISFVGAAQPDGNLLKWSAEEGKTTDRYELRYSTDGIHFITIATIKATGNGGTNEYAYLHQSPAGGNNYYQLVSVDEDGKKLYSNTINIRLKEEGRFSLYPNPTPGIVTIEGDKDELATVTLYNGIGQNITKTAYVEKVSHTSIRLTLTTLPQGVYYIKTKDRSVKIVKQQ